MLKTATLIAATAAALAAMPATAAPARAFDAVTLAQQADGTQFCIRSGWGLAGTYANRLIRRGDCHSIRGWRQRGLAVEVAPTRFAARLKTTEVAAR